MRIDLKSASVRKNIVRSIFFYSALLLYGFIVLYPIFVMILTSLKTVREIAVNPFGFPKDFGISNFASYSKLITRKANYPLYFYNSIFIVLWSIFLIICVSSTASYVLARYKFPFRKAIYLFFVMGLIIPIRLGTISILKIMIALKLNDNLFSIVILSIAVGIPFGVFILNDFIKMIPEELSNAARIDGCSETGIFFRIIFPLLKPAVATVAIVNFIPIWNDFWFPLILLKSPGVKTIPVATAQLFGQYQTDYGLVFAVLTMASLPVIIFYLILSKQFVKGLSAGALKG